MTKEKKVLFRSPLELEKIILENVEAELETFVDEESQAIKTKLSIHFGNTVLIGTISTYKKDEEHKAGQDHKNILKTGGGKTVKATGSDAQTVKLELVAKK